MNNNDIEGLSNNEHVDVLMKILHRTSAVEEENKIWDLGLMWILAYHCQRCNYIWIRSALKAWNTEPLIISLATLVPIES